LPESQGSSSRGEKPDILRRIVETKKDEVERLLAGREDALRKDAAEAPPARDFGRALRRDGEVAVIAEVKRRSPGAGEIRPGLVPAEVAGAYQEAGASAVSVLTDADYFGGGLDDLRAVRAAVSLPALRKDFTIDVRQLWEARAAGADAVLLIVRILDDPTLAALHREAVALGMSALVEVHDGDEMERALGAGATVIGINNRDLGTFRTRLDVTFDLLPAVPASVLVVSESGIRNGTDVARLGEGGVDAVLVGESLLRAEEPGAAAAALTGHPRASR
jgi:indole-3-glycerol phosphate synthase